MKANGIMQMHNEARRDTHDKIHVAGSRNRTLMEMVRAMLLEVGLEK